MDQKNKPFKINFDQTSDSKLNKSTYFRYVDQEKDYSKLSEKFDQAVFSSRHQRIKTYANGKNRSKMAEPDKTKINQTPVPIETSEVLTELIRLSEKQSETTQLSKSLSPINKKGDESITKVLPIQELSELEEAKEKEEQKTFEAQEKKLIEDFFNNLIIPKTTKKEDSYTKPESFDLGLVSEKPLNEEIDLNNLDDLFKNESLSIADILESEIAVEAPLDQIEDSRIDEIPVFEDEEELQNDIKEDIEEIKDLIEEEEKSESGKNREPSLESLFETDLTAEKVPLIADEEAEKADKNPETSSSIQISEERKKSNHFRQFLDDPLNRNSLIGFSVSLILLAAFVLLFHSQFTAISWITLLMLVTGILLTSDTTKNQTIILTSVIILALIFMLIIWHFNKEYNVVYFVYGWFILIPLNIMSSYALFNNYKYYMEELSNHKKKQILVDSGWTIPMDTKKTDEIFSLFAQPETVEPMEPIKETESLSNEEEVITSLKNLELLEDQQPKPENMDPVSLFFSAEEN